MPLRAISISGDIQSFQMTGAQWTELKANYRAMALRMPCCDSPAIPKGSPKGTQFFAHARRGECASAPESEQHLWCKKLITTAAGWTVTTERPGQTPTGEDWIADVFCEKGRAQIALEVQMSPQTEEELRQRQERYRVSGVRSLWFYAGRHSKLLPSPSKDLPAFVLSSFEPGQVPTITEFDAPLPDFVTGLLTKRLQWDTPQINKPVHVEVLEDTCWVCGKPPTPIRPHRGDADRR